jgi:hypothetical protein
MKNGGWLDSYADGGTMQEHQENYNDNSVSLPEGYVGEGYNTKGRDYSPAWGGQFQMGGSVYPVNYVPEAQMGASIPGAVGFSYARTQSPAPSNGPYAKKTKASAQDGKLIYGSPEYKKAYDENRVAYYDEDSDTYINQELAPIEVAGRAKEKGFWQKYVDKIVEENRDASPLEAAIGVPISAVTSLPQLAATYAFTDKMQRPSEAMNIKNPYLAMGTDAILDPANLVGAGVLTKEQALARLAASKKSGLLSNAWRLNPKAYQYNLPENTMWRGLGQEGMEDAVSSGVFRSKQDVVPEFYPGTKLRMDKSFGTNPYFTPKFKTAATYGDQYLGEVPRDVANWRQRYKRTNWSQVADKPIPVDKGRLLQKDWLQGYKPIEIPKQDLSTGINTLEELPSLPEDFLIKIKKLKESSKAIDMVKEDLADPETIRRAEALGVDPEIFAEASKNMTYSLSRDVPSSYSSNNLEININPNQTGRTPEEAIMSGVMNSASPNFTANEIGAHELGHFFQDTKYWKEAYPKTLDRVDRKAAQMMKETPAGKKFLDYHSNYSTRDTAPTKVDEMLKDLEIKTGLDKKYYPQKNKNYFVNADKQYGTDVDNMIEKFPMFREYRQGMRDSGILKNKWDEITPQHIEDFRKLKPENRLNSFMEFNDKNYKLLNEVSKIAPAVLPIGLGAASQLDQKREGGVIKDDMGQWAHPGEITEIDSPYITMQGVPYPVLGVSDTGDVQMMYPEEEYEFDGEKVTEYPMAKNGLRQEQKGLQNLDNITNFTNYNTKQPGGWLDKY